MKLANHERSLNKKDIQYTHQKFTVYDTYTSKKNMQLAFTTENYNINSCSPDTLLAKNVTDTLLTKIICK